MGELKVNFEYRWTKDRLDKIAMVWVDWLKAKYAAKEVPYIEDFCFEHCLASRDMGKYIYLSKLMWQAHSLARSMQKHLLCVGAIDKKKDSYFTKFFLSCEHGMKDNNDNVVVVNGFEEFMNHVNREEGDTGGAEGAEQEADRGDQD